MKPEDVPQVWVDAALNMYWDTDDDYNASMRAALASVIPLIEAREREAWNHRHPAYSPPDPNRERQCASVPVMGGMVPTMRSNGCICPAGAEAGCRGVMCPRRAMEYRT